MVTVDLQSLSVSMLWLSMIGGVCGAVVLLVLLRSMRHFAHWLASTDWWLDRSDRAYVRRMNRSRGVGRPSLLLVLSAVLVAFLAACAPPDIPQAEVFPGHAAFLERARADW